jgi:hypothetical protein
MHMTFEVFGRRPTFLKKCCDFDKSTLRFFELLLFVWTREGITLTKVRARLAASGCLKDVDEYFVPEAKPQVIFLGLLFIGWRNI